MQKVNRGTVDTTQPSLCLSCRAALQVRGVRPSDERVFCMKVVSNNGPMAMGYVSQCSAYDDSRVPSRWDMEQIAWILTTSPGRKVGFLSPEQVRDMNRPVPPPSW